jgi:hypothetical protein
MHHDFKIWPTYFERHLEKRKPWEIRIDDRSPPVQAWDTATLHEWDPNPTSDTDATPKGYTGRQLMGTIPFVMREVMGLKDGYLAFTFDAQLVTADAPAPAEAK